MEAERARQYHRVQTGEHGGEFATTDVAGSGSRVYAPRPKAVAPAKPDPKAGLPASSKFKTLSPDATDNDPQAVKDMQQLLSALGLGNITASGEYDDATVEAVKEAQRRLGIKKPNGKADKGLVTKLLNAYDLSPCVQRSEEPDPSDVVRNEPCEFTVTRSEGDVFDTLRESIEDTDEPVEVVERAVEYAHTKAEHYADPGYQPDGKKRYALDTEEQCRAAWSYINQADNAAKYSPEDLAKVKGRIKAAGKKYGIDFNDTARSEVWTPQNEIMRYDRTWALEDICITRSKDGRTVEAYAAIWDTPSEVRDQHGHYMERISRSAFDKAIRERGDRIPVFYNHGMTIHSTPSDMYSVPIGRSLEVRAESRGLWTLSRYNEGPDADRILEAIRNGAIRAQSFRGRVYKSDPMRIPRPSRTGQLPMVTRTELGLTEYGPTPTPVYADAGILAVRSQAAAAIATLLDRGYDLGRLVELARTSTTPDWEPETSTTSDVEAGTEEPPDGHSARIQQFREELRKRGVLK